MAIATITHVAGAETVSCAAGQSVACGFNIANTSGRPIRLSAEVLTDDPGQARWFTIDGAVERDIGQGSTDDLTVRVSVPADAAPGKYGYRLRVYLSDNTEQTAESATLAIDVPKPEEEPVVKPNGGNSGGLPAWVIIAIVVGVLVIGGAIAGILIFTGGAKVPDLVGSPLDKAVAQLKDAELQFKVTEEMTGEVDGGIVLSQDPPPATEADDDTVVSLRVEAVSIAVPGITGLPVSQAEDALVAEGLALGEVTEAKTETANGGTVLKQTPADGERVLPGTSVDVVVAAESVPVATLTGQTVEEARRTLAGQGLRLGKVSQRRTGGTPGAVLSQTPPGGAKVPAGTIVNVVVESKTVNVPNLFGETQSAAQASLSRSGLKVGTVSRRKTGKTPGTVVSQNPKAGSKVAIGSSVALAVESQVVTGRVLELGKKSVLLRQLNTVNPQIIGGALRAAPPAANPQP